LVYKIVPIKTKVAEKIVNSIFLISIKMA